MKFGSSSVISSPATITIVGTKLRTRLTAVPAERGETSSIVEFVNEPTGTRFWSNTGWCGPFAASVEIVMPVCLSMPLSGRVIPAASGNSTRNHLLLARRVAAVRVRRPERGSHVAIGRLSELRPSNSISPATAPLKPGNTSCKY